MKGLAGPELDLYGGAYKKPGDPKTLRYIDDKESVADSRLCFKYMKLLWNYYFNSCITRCIGGSLYQRDVRQGDGPCYASICGCPASPRP